MKPQALQDAIKANALRKAQKRENGGWKDPQVKVHQMTAEEYLAAKTKSTPAAAAPVFTPASSPAIGSDVLQRIERDRLEMKKSNESLVEEMKQVREQVKECKTLIDGLSSKERDRPDQKRPTEPTSEEMKQIREQVKECKSMIDGLSKENKLLKEEIAKLKQDIGNVQSNKTAPKKPEKPSLNPHTATEMAEMQRKDKALKEYLKTQQGLFPYKSMSVQEYEEQHIVLFYRKVYVPQKLREKTVDWFFKNHKTEAETALNKSFIWLEIDKDVADYKARK